MHVVFVENVTDIMMLGEEDTILCRDQLKPKKVTRCSKVFERGLE